MRVRHETALSILSMDISPEEISRRLGVEADRSAHQGERRSGPLPVPRTNQWSLVERSSQRLEDQVGSLIRRVDAVHEELIDLSNLPGLSIGLSVVRYLGDPAGIKNNLGVTLTADTVSFLASIKAAIDLDEYGTGQSQRLEWCEQDAGKRRNRVRAIRLAGSSGLPPQIRKDYRRDSWRPISK